MSRKFLLKIAVLQMILLPLALVATADQYVYSVPVPADLSAYATLPLSRYRVRERDQKVRVDYELPRELVGRRLPVRFEGKLVSEGQPLELTGPLGRMVCQQGSCRAEYVDLRINEAQVEAHLQNISATPLELNQRRQVARLFGGSPIGIIHRIAR